MTAIPGARRSAVATVIPAAAVPLLGFLFFTSTGRDDAYISYWAARTLAKTGNITNYNGARLEQSSSLLQTALLAGLNRITTLSIPDLGIWVGIAAGAAAAAIAGRLAERISPGTGLTAAALTGVSPFLVYWSFGGLEAPIVALLLVATAGATASAIMRPSTKSLVILAVVTVCFVTVRPEAELVFGCAALAAVALSLLPWAPPSELTRGRWRGPAIVLGVGVVVSLLLTGWRKWYFGSVEPQTVSAKVGGVRIGTGLHYLRLWWLHWWMLPLLLAGLAGVVVVTRRRSWPAAMLVFFLAGYGGFVVLTGGDWMEAGRFLVPLAPLVAVLSAVALREIRQDVVRRLLAAALLATQLVGVWWVADKWSTGRPAWSTVTASLPAADVAAADAAPWYERSNRVHYRDLAFLGHLNAVLNTLAKRQSTITVASGQAGMLPYYFMQQRQDQVTFIDRGSLTTNTFHRCSHALIRTSLGAGMTFDYWLTHTSECGVPAPDVVYDVGSFSAITALSSEYTLVYQQPAVPIEPNTSHLRGTPTPASEFIAVRTDLLPLAAGQ